MTRTLRHIEQFRKGDACIEVRDASGQPWAGVSVSVEQESHDFVFGCVVPDLPAYSDPDRRGYHDRLEEVFNHLVLDCPPPGEPVVAGMCRIDMFEPIPLGRLRVRLEEFASGGVPLEVHVRGETVAVSKYPGEREAGRRVAELYTLCFGLPVVGALIWHGFADGEPGVSGGGLLRRNLAPKYAHVALRKLIGTIWHSRAFGTADAEGRFSFRGFFGSYRVVVTSAGPTAHVEMIRLQSEAAGSGPRTFPVTLCGV